MNERWATNEMRVRKLGGQDCGCGRVRSDPDPDPDPDPDRTPTGTPTGADPNPDCCPQSHAVRALNSLVAHLPSSISVSPSHF